jgi:hypothetical protein
MAAAIWGALGDSLQPEKEGDEAVLEVVSAQIGDARVDGTVKVLTVAPDGF